MGNVNDVNAVFSRALMGSMVNNTVQGLPGWIRTGDRSMVTGKHPLNESCGYPETVAIEDYVSMYDRNGVGARVVNIWPDECWRVYPDIFESMDDEDTEFEKAVKMLASNPDIHLFHSFHKVDRLSGIGRYGVLLLGFNDGIQLREEVQKRNELELLYLRAFDESVVEISEYETDVSSPRYGSPTIYKITMADVSSGRGHGETTKSIDVHWTRVMHVADGTRCDENLGVPRMQLVYNRLLDIDKILGGSAEMFWRGGFPGLAFETLPDVELDSDAEDNMIEQINGYINSLNRYVTLQGVSAKTLNTNVADPRGHLESQIEYICATIQVPKRIFMGSEQGQLASSQDKSNWAERIMSRQNGFLSQLLVRPFIDRLVGLGVLPKPKEVLIEWPDLSSPSEKERAEVMKIKSEALSKYASTVPAHEIIPHAQFLRIFMGLDAGQIEAIEKELDRQFEEEDDLMEGMDHNHEPEDDLELGEE